jgi:hypothetical protein
MYADGNLSGPSAYALRGVSGRRRRRRRKAVGVRSSTPTATVGVVVCVGVYLPRAHASARD